MESSQKIHDTLSHISIRKMDLRKEKSRRTDPFLLKVDQKEAWSVGSNRRRRKRKENPPLLYNLVNCRMTVQRFKIRMRHCGLCRNCMKKEACNLSENRCKGTFHSSGKEISRNLNGLSKYPMATLI